MTPEELATLVESNRDKITQVPGFEAIKPRKRTAWIDPEANRPKRVQLKPTGVWMTPARMEAYKAKRERNRLKKQEQQPDWQDAQEG